MNAILKTVVFILTISVITIAQASETICYYGSWAKYRSGNGRFAIENIDSKLCTISIYCFIGVNGDASIKPYDANDDLNRFLQLKQSNPKIKLLVAVGGWNEGSSTYSQIASSADLRSKFVTNVVNFIERNKLDGLDFDWEYPTQRGGVPNDKDNFITLLRDLRLKFNEKRWLLTVAVSAAEYLFSSAYDAKSLSRYVDYINLMTYDMHGSWEPTAGQNSPLYSSAADNTQANQHSVIQRWKNAGADPKKLVLGLAFYGRTYVLQNPNINGVGAPITGAGLSGPYTQEVGILSYLEICEKLRRGEFKRVWDNEQKTPYAIGGNNWVGYDDIESITIKAQYALNNGLGGVMVWSIDYEDRHNVCGNGPYPLLTAIKNVLQGNISTVVTTSTTQKPNFEEPIPTTSSPTATTPTASNSTKPQYISQDLANLICKLRKNGRSFGNPLNQCTEFYYDCAKGQDDEYHAYSRSCGPSLKYDERLRFCNFAQKIPKCRQNP